MPFSGSCLIFFLPLRQLAVLGDDDLTAGDGGDFAGFFRDDDGARIASDAVFETGGHKRRFGNEQRHGLALHVRTHQRAVRVVVFEERNQRRGHRDQLLRRHVHVIHPRRLDINEVALATAGDAFGGEMALLINRRIGLGDDVIASSRSAVR